jgi:hypothetical protein
MTPKEGRGKPVFHIEYVIRTPPKVEGGKWGVFWPLAPNMTEAQIRDRLCFAKKPDIKKKLSTVIKVSEYTQMSMKLKTDLVQVLKLDGWV